MTKIGYHCSHEQFSPRELLSYIQEAESAGFETAMSSDHISPWSAEQGQSGFGWSWLGGALQATQNMTFGSLSVPCGWRYHPAIIAQAAATLAEMSCGRFQWIAVGSGEASNELTVSNAWPDKQERHARLKAGIEIIRALWRGETVTRNDGFFNTQKARIWSLPEQPLKIIGAALTPQTAEWLGSHTDGLITVNAPKEKLQGIIDAYRRGGGEGKPTYLQVHVSYAATDQEALENAFAQWKNCLLSPEDCANLKSAQEIEEKMSTFQLDDMKGHLLMSADIEKHVDLIRDYVSLGFDAIFLHNVGRNQSEFIKAFGKDVLPTFG